jgi:hypothetical protein
MEQNNLHSIGIPVDETFLRKSVRVDILIPYYIVEKNIFQNTFFPNSLFPFPLYLHRFFKNLSVNTVTRNLKFFMLAHWSFQLFGFQFVKLQKINVEITDRPMLSCHNNFYNRKEYGSRFQRMSHK